MDQGPNWYAVYTKSRQEKKLVSRLANREIEAYTPLRKTLKQWSDRKKWVEEVLIRSYVFVNVHPSQYDLVLNTPGAVRYVWFEGKPARIPANQIEILKRLTGSPAELSPVPCNMKPGTPVRVIAGPFQGLTGELLDRGTKHNVMIRIDHLETAISLTISPEWLEEVTSDE